MGSLNTIASDLSTKLEAGDIPGTDTTRSDLLWYTLNNIADTAANSDTRYANYYRYCARVTKSMLYTFTHNTRTVNFA